MKMFSVWLGLILKVQLNGKSRQQHSSSISQGMLDPSNDQMLHGKDLSVTQSPVNPLSGSQSPPPTNPFKLGFLQLRSRWKRSRGTAEPVAVLKSR